VNVADDEDERRREFTRRFALVTEGHCPECNGELVLRAVKAVVGCDHVGWCDACGEGWRARTMTADDGPFHQGEHVIGRFGRHALLEVAS
jgi:ssDNA-binding Zn-finger/Zn-ribbon topoisomerase 1